MSGTGFFFLNHINFAHNVQISKTWRCEGHKITKNFDKKYEKVEKKNEELQKF